MSRKVLYPISGAVVLVNALGMLFMPDFFWGTFGLPVDTLGAWIGRLMTAVMLANVYLFWRLKDAPRDSIGARYFSQGQVIAWGLTAVFTVIAIFVLRAGPLVWIQVLVSAALAVLSALDAYKS